MSFVTILGSIMTIILPDSCFTADILINIHAMWLHCGSLIVYFVSYIFNLIKEKEGNEL